MGGESSILKLVCNPSLLVAYFCYIHDCIMVIGPIEMVNQEPSGQVAN